MSLTVGLYADLKDERGWRMRCGSVGDHLKLSPMFKACNISFLVYSMSASTLHTQEKVLGHFQVFKYDHIVEENLNARSFEGLKSQCV